MAENSTNAIDSFSDAPTEAPVVENIPVPRVVDALRIYNFRLFFFGAFVSNMGTWLQSTALAWLILELTHSAFWVSMVAVAQFGPMLLLGLVGGVVADRFERRRILLLTQILMLISAAVLTYISLTGRVSLATVMPIVVLGGCALAFNAPAFQSFIADLVPRSHVPAAVSLNASQFSLSRVLGPALAGSIMAAGGAAGGLILASRGAAMAFGINTITFLAVIGALLMIKVPPHERSSAISGDSFRWAFRTISESPPIRTLLTVAMVLSLLSAPVIALLPVVAKTILAGGAETYGQLFAGFGIGAALGSLNSAKVIRVFGYAKLVLVGGMIQTLLLVAIAGSTSFILTLSLVCVFGGLHSMIISSTSTALQLVAPPRRRGRVMSLFLMAFAGLFPLGSLLGGLAADALGVPASLMASAALLGLSVLLALRFRHDLSVVEHRAVTG